MSLRPFSGLVLVNRVDTWPYYQQDPAAYRSWMRDYYYVMIEGYPKPFGYMHKSILQGFVRDGDGTKLDSTVAGVVRSGERPVDCMARKIAVEASVPEEYTRAHIAACGAVSYQMSITSTGDPGCQHIVSHLYEMEFGQNVIPRPGSDEVETFTLMTLDDVKIALMEGDFAANRAMVWLAYLVRHGVLTPENAPDFVEICQRLQRKHDLFIVER